MEELITPILNFIESVGFVGLLTILAVPKLRRLVFNGTHEFAAEVKKISDRLCKHMDDEDKARKEMVKTISNMQEDIAYIKGKMSK